MALQTLETARTAIEATRGTFVTPTRLLYFEPGNATWEQNVASISPLEAWNSYFEQRRVYPGIERDKFTFTVDTTYDQLALWLSVFCVGGLTGTGAGADKTWAGIPLGTDTGGTAVKSLTLEYGPFDSPTFFKSLGLMGSKWDLTIKKGEQLRSKIELWAPKAATQIGALDGALSDRTEVTALGTTAVVDVDTSTIGTTVDANFLEAQFSLDMKPAYLDVLDGTNTAAQILRPLPRSWECTVVRYFANVTELNTYLAKTERKVRLKTTGPALGGSAYSFTLDMYGFWDSASYTRVNGLICATMKLMNLYDATAVTDFSMTAVNSLAAIT